MKRTLAILGLVVLTGLVVAGCDESGNCCGTCGGGNKTACHSKTDGGTCAAKTATCAEKTDGACATKGEKVCASKTADGEAKACCGGKEATCPSKTACAGCNKPKAECACPKK